MKHPNKKIMRELIDYTIRNTGKGNSRTGCFIVKEDKIVAKGISTVERNKDPTAHGEINTISKYCKQKIIIKCLNIVQIFLIWSL